MGDAAHIMYAGVHRGKLIDYAGPDDRSPRKGHSFVVGKNQVVPGACALFLGT